MNPAIRLGSVSKAFGAVRALDDVSFEVETGRLFGLIGPDGAGKTTLIRIVASLLTADAGTVQVLGNDPAVAYRSIRKRIGYMPGRFSLYPDLSVEENLRFFATVFGTPFATAVERVRDIYAHLEPFRTRRAGALSGGMKQKLALCCALIHEPDLLLLDEPTTGVDAVSRREFWDMLAGYRDRGLTILVSTPYMDEAARCDRIAFIRDGRILAVDSPQTMPLRFPHPLFRVRSADRAALAAALATYPHRHSAYAFGDSTHVADARPGAGPESLLEWLEAAGIPARVEPIAPGLEDVFMELDALWQPV